MITLFNRKELTVTYDMNEQARVRTGSYGQNTDAMIEYIIYVKKADYERAGKLIQK